MAIILPPSLFHCNGSGTGKTLEKMHKAGGEKAREEKEKERKEEVFSEASVRVSSASYGSISLGGNGQVHTERVR